MVRLPNALATARGRLIAFFLLYVTEGIPIGFAATTMAAQMRRQGVGPAEIGAFVAALYLPWAFKWMAGPVVDVLRSRRFGARRAWILSMQVAMIITLGLAAQLDPVSQLSTLMALILLHNGCAAVQDVAIDALAVGSLQADERGRAAGLMFAGANLGQALGGAGALAVSAWLGYAAAVTMVCAALISITLLVVWPMRESEGQPVPGGLHAADAETTPARVSAWAEIRERLGQFGRITWQTMREEPAARLGLLMAVLPPGCMSLALALQTNLGVDLGLGDQDLAGISLATTLLSAAGCLIGGQLADRWGRAKTFTLAVVGMAVPVLALALTLLVVGEPKTGGATGLLPTVFWWACAGYGLFNGFMYGSAMALFMDLTRPAVAATQFTAYTALMNLAITLSARWQGLSIEAWGYAWTLMADVALGSVVLLVVWRVQRRLAASRSQRTG